MSTLYFKQLDVIKSAFKHTVISMCVQTLDWSKMTDLPVLEPGINGHT